MYGLEAARRIARLTRFTTFEHLLATLNERGLSSTFAHKRGLNSEHWHTPLLGHQSAGHVGPTH